VILLTGGTGQIGIALRRALVPHADVAAPTRAEVDLRSPAALRAALQLHRPSVVINAAGFTAVDRAESEPTEAFAVNAEAPGVLAEECARRGALFVHFSTDYIFDGAKKAPYIEDDAPHPLSLYGESKLAGERAVAAAGGAFLIVRTSWIYAASGKNFVETIRRLARERDELAVVGDQVGAPTSASAVARGVASMLWRLAEAPDVDAAARDAAGIYHMSAGGAVSWYDFALRILADDPRSAEHRCQHVRLLTSAEYGAPARRPRWSVLDNGRLVSRFGVRLAVWEEQWRDEVRALR